ncbi:spore gernimation protein XA [Bacillus cereus]|nr:spore gernimation protein XA [Bacillus cereus]PGU71328.1 spore gernimation protein XA [Bacillus cereus]
MEKLNGQTLNSFEYIIFIHSIQLASGMLTMPRPLAATASIDGWISIILGWIITTIIGVLIIITLQKNPDKDFFQILTNYFGKWLGLLFFILYAIFLFFAGFSTLLKATDIIKVWIFPSTPVYQIVILLIIPFIILASSGLRSITNYSLVAFFFGAWIPIMLIFSVKNNYNFLHLLPILKDGIFPVIKGLKETITPFAGLEVAYFIYPFLQKKEKAIKGIVIANTVTMFFYVFITISSYVYFSPEGIKTVVWPVFQQLKGIQFSFLERFEVIYIAYYLIIFSTTIYPYFFFSKESIKNLFSKVPVNWIHISFVLLIIGIFTFFNPNLSKLEFIYFLMDLLNFIFFIILPTFFFIYSIIFTRFTRRNTP